MGGSLLVGSVTRFRDSFSVLSIFKNENITKEGSKYCQIRKNPQKVPKDIQILPKMVYQWKVWNIWFA